MTLKDPKYDGDNFFDLGPYESIGVVRKFWRTKKAIKIGLPVYKLTRAEIAQKGLMGPWAFNFQESIIAGIPALVAVKAISFFYPKWKNKFLELPETIVGSVVNLPQETSQIAQSLRWDVYSAISPFVAPLLLMTATYIAAWAALRKHDRTKDMTRTVKVAYLYFDGAYGLRSQMAAAFLLPLYVLIQQMGLNRYDWVSYGFIFLSLIISYNLLVVSYSIIPSKLRGVIGYKEPKDVPEDWIKRFPTLTYFIVMTVSLGIIGVFFNFLLNESTVSITYVLAMLKTL